MDNIELEAWQKDADGNPLPEGTIPLRDGIEDGGVKFKVLKMRAPRVSDELTAEKQAKGATDAQKEVQQFANLCEVSFEAMASASRRDYKRIQKVYLDFLD